MNHSSKRIINPSAEDCSEQIRVHQPTDVDQLNYIEDMVLELKEMASRAGFETLSGILDMALREARLRKTG